MSGRNRNGEPSPRRSTSKRQAQFQQTTPATTPPTHRRCRHSTLFLCASPPPPAVSSTPPSAAGLHDDQTLCASLPRKASAETTVSTPKITAFFWYLAFSVKRGALRSPRKGTISRHQPTRGSAFLVCPFVDGGVVAAAPGPTSSLLSKLFLLSPLLFLQALPPPNRGRQSKKACEGMAFAQEVQ